MMMMIVGLVSSFQVGRKNSHHTVPIVSRLHMAQNYQNLLLEALKMRQQSTNFIQQAPNASPSPSATSSTSTDMNNQNYQSQSAVSTTTAAASSSSTSTVSSGSSSSSVDTKQAWVPTNEPKTAREKASFKNKIPFNEEMYEVLKSSIELLSDRMSTKQPLTVDQVTWLSDAVEIIISDAKMFGPPARPVRSPDDKTE